MPIQFGNNDAFPGIHEYAVIQDQLSSVNELTDFIFGPQGNQLSFDTPGNLQAATTLQDWAQKGYFTPGFGGGGYDTAVANFAKGQGLFMITGNWIVANLGADNRNFGFFLMPPLQAGGLPVATGGAGFPLAITTGSTHPDVAAAYIDWMTSDDASDLLLPAGQIPLHTGASTASVQARHRAGGRGERRGDGLGGQRHRPVPRLGDAHLLRHGHRGGPGADGHADHTAGVRDEGRTGLLGLPELSVLMDPQPEVVASPAVAVGGRRAAA